MPHFLLHTHSIMSFIMFIVKVGVFIFIYRVRHQVPIGRLMCIYYLSLAVWQLDQAYQFSVHPLTMGTLLSQYSTAFIFSLSFGLVEITYLQFLYRFLYHPFKRESTVILFITSSLAVGLFILNFWNEFYNQSNSQIFQLGAFGYGLLTNAWALTLCCRKAWYLRNRDDQAAIAYWVLAAVNVGFVMTSVVAGVFGFYSPVGYWTYFLTVWIGNLVQVVVYINYGAVPTSFQVKISAFSFITVITFLTVVTLVFFPPVMPNDLPVRLAQQEGLAKMFAIIVGATLFTMIALPRILRRSLTIPLQRLLAGVQQVNGGNLNATVLVSAHDEIGILTENFNQMTSSLRHAQEKLTTYAQTLEQKVTERTTELKQKSTDLERSLSHLKTTQAQLIQAEKMASLGELTAGIAHEIQNPLNFVTNFSEVSSELVEELIEGPFQKLPDSEKTYAGEILDDLTQNLTKINHHGGRASAIVKGMLEHSRTNTGERRSTNLNQLADEYLKIAYHGLKAKDKEFNVELKTEFEPELSLIELVPQEVGRVLLNLYNNAFYAVREKQKTAASGYQPTITVSTSQHNGHTEIRVNDNGTGMSESVKSKIFQPFFTTKPTGEGTGLGLSLSYDIVTKGHQGSLLVQSQEGIGTEFVVQLPTSKVSPLP